MLLQTEHISLADDNTSVNGDDVYEDDWEGELEKDDSEEESGSRDDEEAEPSENVSHVSGNGYNYIQGGPRKSSPPPVCTCPCDILSLALVIFSLALVLLR
jgi:hypothetical protein